MTEPLAIYLQDHLAASNFAIKLLQSLRDQHADEPLGEFAATLLEKISEDQATLMQILEQVSSGHKWSSKHHFAWLSEKTTRLKLHRRTREGLGTLEKLEMLALGILGKLALWDTLAQASGLDARLRATDFEQLASRARSQHAEIEVRRLEAARSLFAAPRPAR